MKSLVPDNTLSIEMLPPVGDRNAVFKFAMTFDGYEYFGSLEASAEKARQRSRATLAEVRNELFFSARASRHCDDDHFLERYAELLPHFRALLSAREKGGAPEGAAS